LRPFPSGNWTDHCACNENAMKTIIAVRKAHASRFELFVFMSLDSQTQHTDISFNDDHDLKFAAVSRLGELLFCR